MASTGPETVATAVFRALPRPGPDASVLSSEPILCPGPLPRRCGPRRHSRLPQSRHPAATCRTWPLVRRDTAFRQPEHGLGVGQLILGCYEPATQFREATLRVAASTCPVHHARIMSLTRKINRCSLRDNISDIVEPGHKGPQRRAVGAPCAALVWVVKCGQVAGDGVAGRRVVTVCRSRPTTACGAMPRRWRAGSTRTGTASSGTSARRLSPFRRPVTR